MQQERIHYEIQKAFDDYSYVIVEAFRGSGKTTQGAEVRTVWELGHDPNKFYKIVCEGKEQALDRVRNIKQHIDLNDRIKKVFPNLRPHPSMPWTDHAITVRRTVFDRNPSVGAWGYSAAGVGGRAHVLIGDDAVPPSAMSSVADREDNIRMWENVWAKMLLRGGRVRFLCTPWSELDLGSKLKRNAKYKHIRCAVGGSPDFENPWSSRLWPPSALKNIYYREGSLSYSRSHELQVMTAETSLFPPSVLHAHPENFRADLRLGMPWRYWQSRNVIRYIGVDLALSAGASGDYFVIFTWGVDLRGNLYVVDIVRERSNDYTHQLSLITQAYAKHLPDLVYIEGTQFQRIYTDILRQTTNIPVKPFYPLGKGRAKNNPGAEKTNMLHGIPALRVLFENGKIIIPRGDERSIELTDIFLDELSHMAFTPEGKIEGVGAHDDVPMAAWTGFHAARRASVAALGIESDDDKAAGSPLDAFDEDFDTGIPSTPESAADGLLRLSTHASSRRAVVDETSQVRDENRGQPRPVDYEAIYATVSDIVPKDADGAVESLLSAQKPTARQLLDARLSPRTAGAVTAAMQKWAQRDVLYVLRDIQREQREASGIMAGWHGEDVDDGEEGPQEPTGARLDPFGLFG